MATGTIQLPTADRTGMVEVYSWTYGKVYLMVDNRLKLAWLSKCGNSSSPSSTNGVTFSITNYCMPATQCEITMGKGGQISIYKNDAEQPDGLVYVKTLSGQTWEMGMICFPIE